MYSIYTLPIAYCLRPIAYCQLIILLPIAYCLVAASGLGGAFQQRRVVAEVACTGCACTFLEPTWPPSVQGYEPRQ